SRQSLLSPWITSARSSTGAIVDRRSNWVSSLMKSVATMRSGADAAIASKLMSSLRVAVSTCSMSETHSGSRHDHGSSVSAYTGVTSRAASASRLGLKADEGDALGALVQRRLAGPGVQGQRVLRRVLGRRQRVLHRPPVGAVSGCRASG